MSSRSPCPPIAEVDADDLALIAVHSRDVGAPEGRDAHARNLRANIEQMRASPIAIGPDDVVLCVLPLFHIFGLNVVLNLAVAVGAKIVLTSASIPALPSKRSSNDAVTVDRRRSSRLRRVAALRDAPDDAFANVRVAVSGAAPLTKEARAVPGAIRRHDLGGLRPDRDVPGAHVDGGRRRRRSPARIGRPLPGVELRLVDEDGEDVEEGDPGEIVVRGPNVFKRYWNQPEDTEAASSSDGWFRTGDVGVLDDDGDLYIVDRRKDLSSSPASTSTRARSRTCCAAIRTSATVAVVGAPRRQHRGTRARDRGRGSARRARHRRGVDRVLPREPRAVQDPEGDRDRHGDPAQRGGQSSAAGAAPTPRDRLPLAAAIVAAVFARRDVARCASRRTPRCASGPSRSRSSRSHARRVVWGIALRLDAARLPRLLPLRRGAQRRVARARHALARSRRARVAIVVNAPVHRRGDRSRRVSSSAPTSPECGDGARVARQLPAPRDVMPDVPRTLSRIFSIGGSVVVLAGLLWASCAPATSLGLALARAGVVIAGVASEFARAGHVGRSRVRPRRRHRA